jgi:hypothetical protein
MDDNEEKSLHSAAPQDSRDYLTAPPRHASPPGVSLIG